MGKKGDIFFFTFMFPPWQSPASVRMVKFVKYLIRLGWNCVVVTSDTGPMRGVFYDEQLLKEIPSTVRVIRVRSFLPHGSTSTARKRREKPSTLKRLIKSVAYDLIFPDHYILWSFFALFTARRLVKKGDIVFTTLSPYSTAITGLFLKMMCGARWVIDYRDGWTTDPFYKFTKVKKAFESLLESCCVKLADAVTCVSDPLKNDLERAFSVRNKVIVIENGLDFEDYKVEFGSNLLNGKTFNYVYTGMLSTRTRDITHLLHAVDILVNRKGIKNVKIYFIGAVFDAQGGVDTTYQRLVTQFGLENNVTFIPPVSRRESLAYQQQADCLILIYTSKGDVGSVMSSKIFEYIYAQKPIIGLIKKSAARDLIEGKNLGVCADPFDPDEIAESLLKIYNNPHQYPDDAYFEEITIKYDRKNLSLQLSNLLEKIHHLKR